MACQKVCKQGKDDIKVKAVKATFFHLFHILASFPH